MLMLLAIGCTQSPPEIKPTPTPVAIATPIPTPIATPTPTPEIPVFNNSNITPIVVAPIENKTTPNITYITYSGGSGRHRSFSLSPPSTPTPAQIPEFTSVGAMLAVAGSGVGMYLIRRRKNEKT
jgi:hypothetical protein